MKHNKNKTPTTTAHHGSHAVKKIDGWDSLGARSDGHHALRSDEPHGGLTNSLYHHPPENTKSTKSENEDYFASEGT
jgi:hypothetical protein